MTSRPKTTKKAGNFALSKESLVLLADLLHILGKYEQSIEMKRQFLATNENFEPY